MATEQEKAEAAAAAARARLRLQAQTDSETPPPLSYGERFLEGGKGLLSSGLDIAKAIPGAALGYGKDVIDRSEREAMFTDVPDIMAHDISGLLNRGLEGLTDRVTGQSAAQRQRRCLAQRIG